MANNLIAAWPTQGGSVPRLLLFICSCCFTSPRSLIHWHQVVLDEYMAEGDLFILLSLSLSFLPSTLEGNFQSAGAVSPSAQRWVINAASLPAATLQHVSHRGRSMEPTSLANRDHVRVNTEKRPLAIKPGRAGQTKKQMERDRRTDRVVMLT